jgi:3',5'-cyclic-nucleotide phosphodiesterase
MDYAACNIVYVDRRAGGDRLVKREPTQSNLSDFKTEVSSQTDAQAVADHHDVQRNLETLLGTFSEGTFQDQIS